MKKIIALGPNPAWQKTLFFDHFRYGEVNRAREMQVFPAGKGINFCRAAMCHGKTEARLIQFAGGDTGEYVRKELEKEGMPVWSVVTSAATRTCTTCLDQSSQVMTEVIEPSFAATGAEVDTMLEYLSNALPDSDGAALCGTLPTGTDPLLYLRAIELIRKRGIPVLIDSFRDIRKVLESGAEIWLKINLDELKAMTGCNEIRAAFAQVFNATTVKYAAITDGPGNAYACDGRSLAIYRLPKLERVINPIGCGDTASSVWMSEMLTGTDPLEAFRVALAAASANCLSAFPGSFAPSDAVRIAAGIQVECDSL